MRWSWRCESGESLQAEARFPDSSPATASPSKKSLQAAERKRADVARARRRWIREQGLLDSTRLVFIDETAVSTNMVRPNGWNPRGERLVGDVPDSRMDEAIYFLRSKQQPDGTWQLENTHPGKVHFALEDGDRRPSRWNTLRALRVLSWYEQSAT